MPRVEIGTPNQFLFSMERAVGISDLNYAKHLDSVAMLQILNEARLQFLAHLGFSEANVFGLGLVVADQAVDFRSNPSPETGCSLMLALTTLIATALTFPFRLPTAHSKLSCVRPRPEWCFLTLISTRLRKCR